MNDQQKVSIKIKTSCSRCGRVLSRGSGGSLTSWIFKESRCRCANTEALVEWRDGNTQPIGSREDVVVPASLLSRFEVVGCLGTGGMGAVFRVVEKSTGEHFALKVMHQELMKDATASQRFTSEAKASLMISHQNVVAVREFGLSEEGRGSPFILMELIDGKNLDQILSKEKVLWVSRAIDIFMQIAEGLSFAHTKNITHRDIKPSNIIVYEDSTGAERVKIVDFGIAKFAGGDQPSQNLTQTGQVFGSPLYMSPEQCEGGTLDPRSDIYSFGCMLYECLTGRPPFCNTTAIKTIIDHLTEKVPPIRPQNLNVSKSLESLVMRCLEKNREKRYQSMDQVLSDLLKIRQGAGLGAPRRAAADAKLVALGAAALILTCALIVPVTNAWRSSIKVGSTEDAPAQTFAVAGAGKSGPGNSSSFAAQVVGTDKRLVVKKVDLTDEDMKEIAAIGYLSSLGFENNKLKDEQFKFLSNMKIESLALDAPTISGTGLNFLKNSGIRATFLLNAKFSPAGFQALAQLPNLDYISIIGGTLSDSDMKYLSQIPYLTGISISDVPVTDACLADLSKVKTLRRLSFANTRVRGKSIDQLPRITELTVEKGNLNDADLKSFSSLKNLQLLSLLNNQGITTNGIAAFGPLQELSSLDLSGTSIDDSAFKHLHSFPQLSSLGLSDTRVTVKGTVDGLSQRPKITDVTIGAPFTDQTIAMLARVKNLRKVTIAHCAGITDKGILALRSMNLNLISIIDCPNITQKGREQFRLQSPNTQIIGY